MFKWRFMLLVLAVVGVTAVWPPVCQASSVNHKASHKIQNEVVKALRLIKNGVEDEYHKIQHDLEQKKPNKKLMLKSFAWNNCGSSGDLATIKSLSVSPDPIHVPGNVTVSFSGSLSQQVAAPLQLSLTIKKKELFWIPIPCVDNLGSCDYNDICTMLASFQCPPAFTKHGIPCKCPVKSGAYNLPSSVIDVTSFGIPSWLEDGDFQVTVTLTNNGHRVMCVHVSFTLG